MKYLIIEIVPDEESDSENGWQWGMYEVDTCSLTPEQKAEVEALPVWMQGPHGVAVMLTDNVTLPDFLYFNHQTDGMYDDDPLDMLKEQFRQKAHDFCHRELKQYEVEGGTEWAHDPSVYQTDPREYQHWLDKGRAALMAANASYIVFNYVRECVGAGFLEEAKEGEIATHQAKLPGYNYPAVLRQVDSFEVRWQGPHLRVFDSFAYLFWSSKHSDDEIIVDLGI